jgi:hypothetical protein
LIREKEDGQTEEEAGAIIMAAEVEEETMVLGVWEEMRLTAQPALQVLMLQEEVMEVWA